MRVGRCPPCPVLWLSAGSLFPCITRPPIAEYDSDGLPHDILERLMTIAPGGGGVTWAKGIL